MANAFDAPTFQAFSLALLQLDSSRLATFQPSPQQIGDLATRQPSAAADQIRQLVDQHPDLKAIYDPEYKYLQQFYQTQERAKGFSDALSLDSRDTTISANDRDQDKPAGSVLKIIRANDRDRDETARFVLKQDKPKHFTQPYITYINRLQHNIAAADRSKISVLKALEQRPISIEDLVYVVGLPFGKVSDIVQNLWKRGYLDRINSGFFSMLFPQPKKHQSHALDPKIPLALTSTGYFFLHPIITASPSAALNR